MADLSFSSISRQPLIQETPEDLKKMAAQNAAKKAAQKVADTAIAAASELAAMVQEGAPETAKTAPKQASTINKPDVLSLLEKSEGESEEARIALEQKLGHRLDKNPAAAKIESQQKIAHMPIFNKAGDYANFVKDLMKQIVVNPDKK